MNSKEPREAIESSAYTIPATVFQEVAMDAIGRELDHSELLDVIERLDDYVGFEYICESIVECIEERIDS